MFFTSVGLQLKTTRRLLIQIYNPYQSFDCLLPAIKSKIVIARLK